MRNFRDAGLLAQQVLQRGGSLGHRPDQLSRGPDNDSLLRRHPKPPPGKAFREKRIQRQIPPSRSPGGGAARRWLIALRSRFLRGSFRFFPGGGIRFLRRFGQIRQRCRHAGRGRIRRVGSRIRSRADRRNGRRNRGWRCRGRRRGDRSRHFRRNRCGSLRNPGRHLCRRRRGSLRNPGRHVCRHRRGCFRNPGRHVCRHRGGRRRRSGGHLVRSRFGVLRRGRKFIPARILFRSLFFRLSGNRRGHLSVLLSAGALPGAAGG